MKFDPDWVVAPGETLREWREHSGLPEKAAATACGRMPLAQYKRVEAGDEPIDATLAWMLGIGTGIPSFLWENLERAYRAGLAAGKTRV